MKGAKDEAKELQQLANKEASVAGSKRSGKAFGKGQPLEKGSLWKRASASSCTAPVPKWN